MYKILQINSVLNIRSTGKIAEEIGLLAMRYDFKSFIAYGRSFGKSSSNVIRIGSNLNVIGHGIFSLLFDGHGLASDKATMEFIKKIELIHPDIIHLQNIHGYYLNYKLLFDFLKHYNKPVVWTLHDCWSFTGHCSYFEQVDCFKWESECNKCPQMRQYPTSLILDRSKENFRIKKHLFTSLDKLVVVAVSNWLGEFVKRSFLKNQQIEVIHNGIDTEIFSFDKDDMSFRQKYNINDKFIILGVASPWSKRKGYDDFIKLSKIVDEDTIIVLVGLNKKQIAQLPGNVIGLSRVDGVSELAKLYATSNLFANLTYIDNFPTTNLEALSSGIPVVTYQTGGSPESLTPEVGFVVEQGNYKAVIDVMRIVKQKGKSYYSEKCHNHIVNNFEKTNMYTKYIEIYKALLY